MAKLLKSLSLSDKVKFGMHQVNTESPEVIVWRIVAKDHESIPPYPANSITLNTDRLIDRRAYDSYEPNSEDSMRKTMGNNRYLHSNILQWLNSDAEEGCWYTPQHSSDSPPDTADSTSQKNTYYAHRAGFLRYFSTKEKNSMLSTISRSVKNELLDGGLYDDVISKVFLPSKTEMGLPNENDIAEGAPWPVYTDNNSRIVGFTQQCHDNSLTDELPVSPDSPGSYLTRTARVITSVAAYKINPTGTTGAYTVCNGDSGILLAINLSGDLLVTDDPDSDGCYTVIFNDPPTISAKPFGDLGTHLTPIKQTYTITDPDGDRLNVIEKLNGNIIRTYEEQESGTELRFDLSSEWGTLELDTPHTASIEVTDGLVTITHNWTFIRKNAAPVITATIPSNIGIQHAPMQQAYTISDLNGDELIVTEKLNGETIRILENQHSGEKLIYDLIGQWQSLPPDTLHTASVEVTDGIQTTIRTWTFYKDYAIKSEEIITIRQEIRFR